MDVYDPKRGHYVEESNLEETAKNIFGSTVSDTFEQVVTVEGEERTATGIIIDPDAPVFERIAVGEVNMDTRKNWVFIDIDEVPDEELVSLLQNGEFDMEDAATQKNRFLTEVTGYEVSELADKVKETARGYDSLSDL